MESQIWTIIPPDLTQFLELSLRVVWKSKVKKIYIFFYDFEKRYFTFHFWNFLGSDGSEDAGEDGTAIKVSHLNLVDLAGSERAKQTGAVGDRLKEGKFSKSFVPLLFTDFGLLNELGM